MTDEPISPQKLIDDAAKSLEKTPVLPIPKVPTVEEKPIDVPIIPVIESLPPLPPTPEPMIIPTKQKEEQNNEYSSSHSIPEKKKARKGLLIATLLFFIFTLPIAIYYVTQSPQFAEIRSRAVVVYPSTTCPNSSAACKPGGTSYFEWLPNHVICGTCEGVKVCGTWEGEPGVVESDCCTSGCNIPGSSYPWHFENQCLSTNTSNREACYNSATDCARVQPCAGVSPTIRPTDSPGATNTPVITNTPTHTATPTNTPTHTATPTNTPTTIVTPTNGPTPAPGTCDASCDSDNNCDSGLSCVTTTGVRRCRKSDCPNESNCSCPGATPTTYYANPTRANLIANVPTTQPTPKIPIAGVGPGIFGAISVVGSILLLLFGLIL